MESYQLTRSKRKSLSIVIGKDGTIQVKAPNWLPKYKIDQFIQQKADWIQEKQREVLLLEQKKPVHTFQEGDLFLFQGEAYRLTFCSRNWQSFKDGWDNVPVTGRTEPTGRAEVVGRTELTGRAGVVGRTELTGRAGIVLEETTKLLLMELDSEETDASIVGKRLEEWYLWQAKQLFPERVSQYYPLVSRLAQHSGKEIGPVNRIAIRNQKTRWGSCSSKGNLNFNWRLVMAPEEILDYVVVHELCHLAHLNHSSQFWQMVRDILPDFRERRNWLKANGLLLAWEV